MWKADSEVGGRLTGWQTRALVIAVINERENVEGHFLLEISKEAKSQVNSVTEPPIDAAPYLSPHGPPPVVRCVTVLRTAATVTAVYSM